MEPPASTIAPPYLRSGDGGSGNGVPSGHGPSGGGVGGGGAGRERSWERDVRVGGGRDEDRYRDDRDRGGSNRYDDHRRYTDRGGYGSGYDRRGGGGYDRYAGGGGRYGPPPSYGHYDDRRGDPRRYERSPPRRDDRGRGRDEEEDARPSHRSVASGRSREEEEVYQLTRDARTIFVGQLVVRAGEDQVSRYFEQVGPVVDVRLIRDKAGRSKGFGYVEFEDLESVAKALVLNGQKFCTKHDACTCSGFPILVKPSEAEKNYAAMAEAAGGASSAANAERSVYLGNLDYSVMEPDLKAIGELMGAVDKVVVLRDARNNPRGFGVIVFAHADAANRAVPALNGFDLKGRPLQAGKMNTLGEVTTPTGERFMIGLEAGHVLSAQARAALAAQLAGAATQAAQVLGSTMAAAGPVVGGVAAGAGLPAPVAPTVAQPRGMPTSCMVIKHVFNPAAETEPGWDADIRDEMKDECNKYGTVIHIHVAKETAGNVYLMFSEVVGAVAAATALNGRLFAGNNLAVEFVTIPDYVSRFPEVASLV